MGKDGSGRTLLRRPAMRQHRTIPGSRPSQPVAADTGQLLARAVEFHQAGRLDAAESLYRSVLRAHPEQPDALHLLGVTVLQRGRPGDAVALIRRAVAHRRDSAIYHGNLGVALQAAGQLEDARASLERAVSLDGQHVDAGFNLGVTLQALGALDKAVMRYQQVLVLAPGHLGALRNLGNSQSALGRHVEAVGTYRRALAITPDDDGLLASLGATLARLGRTEEAVHELIRATVCAPSNPDAWLNLAVAYHDTGRTEEAINAYRHTLVLRPACTEAWHSLGRALVVAGRIEEAIDCYHRALAEFAPADRGDRPGMTADVQAQVLRDLGAAFGAVGRRADATIAFRTAVELRPDDALTWRALGVSLAVGGEAEEAATALDQAVTLGTPDPSIDSERIFVLDLLSTTTPERAFAARRAWNDHHARSMTASRPPHSNIPEPERRLRVGYVSGDFCRHSAATTFLSILEAHDPSIIEVFCYAGNVREDDYTERFRALASHWRPIIGLSDEALDRQIRTDRIDVLVDLSSHSGGNRLPVFARKPAPVQVTAWGYATGTGLDAIDAFFADPVVVPPTERGWYAEDVVYLPSVVCYTPPLVPPPITSLPALSRGTVTFGSYNRPVKITPTVLETWARVLTAVPGSRLVLKLGSQDSASARERLLGPLVRRGIDPTRVELLGASAHDEHMATFGQLDIQLDPFPHTGGVTTLEGLMMGIPCVTLIGERVPARLSASFLTTLGLGDLVAQTLDDYVAIAVRLAQDIDRLSHERATLRSRLLTSPIANASTYTRAVEAAYRTLWRRWCTRDHCLSPAPSAVVLREQIQAA